jgi:signal transduction histidine kinase
VNEYVVNVYQEYRHLMMNNQKMAIKAEKPSGTKFNTSFRPIEMIIILDNLLNNSFRAKAKNVFVYWKSISLSEIELHIQDDGIGIPDKNLDRIFDARFTTTNGSGLGLYHTKEIIEKIGGRIAVNNQLRQGVEFIIKFEK